MTLIFPVDQSVDGYTLSKKLGRCYGFQLVDLKSGTKSGTKSGIQSEKKKALQEISFIANHNNQEVGQGAGTSAAQMIIDSGAKALICADCGPKAFKALQLSDVKIYIAPTESIDELIDLFNRNQLTEMLLEDTARH